MVSVGEQNVLGFQIAVDNLDICQMLQSLKDLRCDPAKLLFRHTLILPALNVLVQIDIENFSHYQEVPPEEEALQHSDHAMFFRLIATDTLQEFGFNLCVVNLTFRILSYLYRNDLAYVFHVSAHQDLAKGTLAADFVNDVSIG